VDLGSLLTTTLTDTLSVSLPLFRTELALAVTVVLLLLCRMLPVLRLLDSALVALGGVPVTINDPKCVGKTFPDYFDVFASVTDGRKLEGA
jgi:hypothetical protein